MGRREHRILVVDDDQAIRSLLQTVLRRRGFLVDSASNGKEALEHMALCRYSVVLLDMMMPTMNGWELLDYLEGQARPRPEIIVLTAGAESHAVPRAIVRATIRKPFDLDIIVAAVQGCVDVSETPMQVEGCPPVQDNTRASESN